MILYNPTVSGSLAVTGSLTTTGTITSQTLVVQTITSSVSYLTGSTQYGSVLTNTHQFTGSVGITGSNAALLNINNGVLYVSASGNVLIGTTTGDNYKLQIVGSNQATSTFGQTYVGVAAYSQWISSSNAFVMGFDGAAGATARMTIAGTGNVGIGTTSPSQLLEVVGGEIKAGRVDSSYEGGQVSFGRSTDNATAWYIDLYGNVASPQLRFVDVAGAAVRMTLTGSNVGIGTSSPSVKLTVVGTDGGSSISGTNNNSTAYTTTSYLGISGLALFNSNISAGGLGVGIIMLPQNTAGAAAVASIGAISLSNSNASSALVFQTRDTSGNDGERMRITSGGDALFGTTTSSGNATGGSTNVGVIIEGANGAITTQRNNTANIFLSKASGFTDGTLINFFTQGINRGSITTNGVNTAYNTSSDYRLKEDLKEYNGLNIIRKLKTYDFKWKDTNIRDYGVMAHELQEVLPNYVNGDKDAINDDGTIKTQAVDYSKLVPVLVKAIQEQQAKITALEEILQHNNIQ